MKQKWVHIAKSFKEAEEFDHRYYAQMTPARRLSIVQELREMDLQWLGKKGPKGGKSENRKGLQRVVKIVQQA